ncbi:botulinum neurotoxin N-terminal receptor binding domain-containing protein [Legionella nautarum]|uniref:botulinum neurotoxin N-terminal receptor binding domain-containing protein n=1 Tax=Legionella nautarum TaxID=45070 RepID=UPI0023786291|nr:botulinum neurotoxin N-terminal receptor binding domain-containing protein [Legionella nautarum]
MDEGVESTSSFSYSFKTRSTKEQKLIVVANTNRLISEEKMDGFWDIIFNQGKDPQSIIDNNKKYKKVLVKYLEKQLARNDLPKESSKFTFLNNMLDKLNDVNIDYSTGELKTQIAEAKMVTSKHRETGLVGFFKLNWIRNTRSYNDLTELFDDNNQMRNK